ncbi:MAG TPA: helix-turn-helix domain-containing protein [Noviherbaspirillum sp.]|uniref:TetR/AcrR family transcriptional regulator n=1 Tax=Noviherbaspirillum sp. TaxID=1926288 RepID=UPI002D2E710D|nr:helix-turn-helix domain-containing protein [Noviherbaspirillum sp.]HYD95584.1 helix-turn-helix domain-containing protein [Noviherbaspirillum sp.]
MDEPRFPGFTFAEFQPLPVSFGFAAFRKLTPLDDRNIWEFVYERNIGKIGVKRKHTALDNLEKIFVATFRLANTIGFRAMTLRDLCRETGLSMGGLYGYIESKDQLAAMIEDVIRHISEISHQWFSHIPDPLDQLEGCLRGYIYFSELLQPWFYFVFLESRALDQEQRNIAKDAELRVQAHLALLLKDTGALALDDAHLLAAHCMALVQDWHLKRWKYRTADISVDAFADSVVKVVRARVGLRGAP